MMLTLHELLMRSNKNIDSDGCVLCHSDSPCPVEGTDLEVRRRLSALSCA